MKLALDSFEGLLIKLECILIISNTAEMYIP